MRSPMDRRYLTDVSLHLSLPHNNVKLYRSFSRISRENLAPPFRCSKGTMDHLYDEHIPNEPLYLGTSDRDEDESLCQSLFGYSLTKNEEPLHDLPNGSYREAETRARHIVRALQDNLSRCKFLLESLSTPSKSKKSPKVLPFSSVVKRAFVEGTVNGIQVEALPDNGASLCFISNSLVSKLGLQPKSGTQKMIRLANKKLIRSPGMVNIPWTFAAEMKKHFLKCWILQESTHDLILGSSFLRATETLTRYRARIKSRFIAIPRRLQLQLLGNGNQRLWGYFNDSHTAAFPDTGSDAMLVSKEYAERFELDIDTDIKYQIELGDGTPAWTHGIVRNVEWKVGELAIRCDFHVLDNLYVDVVLSNKYLFDFNIFSEYSEYLDDDGMEDDPFQLCNIRLISQYGESLNLLEEEYLKDVSSPDAFAPEKVQRELARRDFIRDAIAALPVGQQDAARLSEAERQRRWESLRKANRASRPQLPASQQRPNPSPRPIIPTVIRLIRDGNNPQAKVALRTWWKKKTGVFTTSSTLQSNNRLG